MPWSHTFCLLKLLISRPCLLAFHWVRFHLWLQWFLESWVCSSQQLHVFIHGICFIFPVLRVHVSRKRVKIMKELHLGCYFHFWLFHSWKKNTHFHVVHLYCSFKFFIISSWSEQDFASDCHSNFKKANWQWPHTKSFLHTACMHRCTVTMQSIVNSMLLIGNTHRLYLTLKSFEPAHFNYLAGSLEVKLSLNQ